LIVVGAVAGNVSSPKGPMDEYTVLPMRIFTWTLDSRPAAHDAAAAGIVVLMVVLLLINSGAIYLRNKTGNR